MVNKLCIGTVQFGLIYGINNQSGIPDNATINQILDFAYDKEISFLDTANVYGDAQIKIGNLNNERFKIVGKFPAVNSISELEIQFEKTLSQLKTNSIYGYLAHNADNLIANPELWKILQLLKSKEKIKKIGFSLYNPEQLITLLKLNIVPNLVQLPYSLLDRKFEPYFEKLKSLGTEIHVRSVFLQGLYFMNPLNLPEKIQCIKQELLQLHTICKEFKIDMSALALNYILFNANIDKIVMGIDNISQLVKNYELIKTLKINSHLINEVNKIDVKEKELLNPSNW